MRWQWASPRLMILWRNEASPSADTKRMLNAAARRASRTGRDIAVGAWITGGASRPLRRRTLS